MNMLDYFFHLDQYILALIPEWGTYVYTLIAFVIFMESACILTPFLPGDGLLFMLGVFAAQQVIDFEVTVMVVFFATFIGYGINFYLGRWLGAKIMPWCQKKGIAKSINNSQRFYQNYGIKALVIARFIPVVRTFLPMVIGVINISKWQFWVINFMGATLWVGTLIGLGWVSGKLGMVSSHMSVVIYGIMAISVVPLFYEGIKIMRKKRV